MHLGSISDWSDQVIALRVCGKIAVFDAMPSSLKKPASMQKRPLARSHAFSSTSSTTKKKLAAAKRPVGKQMSHASASISSTKTKTKKKPAAGREFFGIASNSSAPPLRLFTEDNDGAYFNGVVCSDCWMPLGGVANYLKTYQSCVRCGQNICLRCVERYSRPNGLCTHHGFNSVEAKYDPRF